MDAYNGLIDLGYSQNQIDDMDILYHLQLLGRRKQFSDDGQSMQDDEPLYIDDILNGL